MKRTFALAVAALALLGLLPAQAETHAVVVGIDNYKFVTKLRGAVADAQDIAGALKRRGVTDLTLLTDGAVTRASLKTAIEAVIARARRDELVIISFAGHGSQEAWGKVHPAGVKEGDKHVVFMLTNVIVPDTRGVVTPVPGASPAERLAGIEMNLYLSQLEAKGVRTLFVADTCFSGDLTRSPPVASGIDQPVTRSLPSFTYAEGADPLAPELAKLPKSVDPDSQLPSLTFLAAVDKSHASPEVKIPAGSQTARGALSYAVARAIEGGVQTQSPAAITRYELARYVKSTVRLYSENRQDPQLTPLSDLGRVAIDFNRDLSAIPAPPKPDDPAFVKPADETTVRIWSTSGPVPATHGPPGKPDIRPAASKDKADISYDAASRKAWSATGDIIAEDVAPADLQALAEREVARRQLIKLSATNPHQIKLTSGDNTYPCLAPITLDLGDSPTKSGKPDYYALFNLNGNGVVQFLYPDRDYHDPMQLRPDKSELQLQSLPPFGTNLLVLVTSPDPLDTVIDALKALHGKVGALDVVDLLKPALSAETRVGVQGLYTSAGASTDQKCRS